MGTRNRGGGHQSRKHHLRAFHPPGIPTAGGGPCADHAADLPGFATPAGAPGHPIPKSYSLASSCIPVQHPESPLRIRSGADHPDPPRATQPPDGRSATRAIPTLMGGAGAPDTRKLLVNIHPALQCSISGTRLKWPRRTGALLEQKQTGTPCRGWSAPGAFSVCSSKR